MTAFTLGKWAMGVNLAGLMSEFGVLCRIGSDPTKAYAFIDKTAQTAQTLVAGKVNEAIEDYLTQNPRIGGKTGTEFTLTAGTTGYTVPSDMRRMDIRRLYFGASNDNGAYDLMQLVYFNRGQYPMFPPPEINGTTQVTWPHWWTWSIDGTEVELYPTPGTPTVYMVIEYRQAASAITYSNIASPSSVSIGEIPTRHQRVLALYVAKELVRFIPDRTAMVDKYETQYQAALLKAQDEVADALAEDQLVGSNERPTMANIDTGRLWPFRNGVPGSYNSTSWN